jgi:serine/threonine-protein kinase
VQAALLAIASHAFASRACADDADTAAAEALFQQGRALLEAGQTVEACPKLAESQRLDPATGTLIALAACHEQQNKLASAWSEFTEAAGRAERESRPDRRQLASERAQRLEPRLSTLTVQVSPALAAVRGLELTRSERALGRGAWNVPVPLDGGEYVIEARAPQMKTWSAAVKIADEGDRQVVMIPELVPEPLVPAASPPPARLPSPAIEVPAAPKPQGLNRLQWVGIGSGAVGVVALGVGGYFTARMLGKKAEADPYCGGPSGNECERDSEGAALLNDARRFGNFATGFAIASGSLLALGGTLFFVGRNSAAERPAVSLTLTPGTLGARMTGAF